MKDLSTCFLYVACIIFWFNAVIYDITHNNAVWAVADFLIAPLGVIRGLCLFFM